MPSEQLQSKDQRISVRVAEKSRIAWHLRDGSAKGIGRIKNLSTSGMLLEADGQFNLEKDTLLSFDRLAGKNDFVPHIGKLVWHKTNGNPTQHLFGVKFIDPSVNESLLLNNRINRVLAREARLKFFEQKSGLIWTAVISVGLLVFYWIGSDIYQDMFVTNINMQGVSRGQAALTREYSSRYEKTKQELAVVTSELNATKELYQESQLELARVSNELESTKAILIQTESLLTQANENNVLLRESTQREIADIKATLEDKISQLEQQNVLLTTELGALKARLDFYSGNIKNEAEGRALLDIYKQRMATVKTKINAYRKEAQKVRVKALQERDRIKLLLGNNGYFMKNGQQVTVDEQQYNAASQYIPDAIRTPDIEVNIVE